MATLLEVKELKTHFFTMDGVVRAVDGVSYDLEEGETLGLVGESGCGKSVSALSLMRLIPDPPGKIVNGEVYLDGEDILKIDMDEIAQRTRGENVHGVPGTDDLSKSGVDDRTAIDRDATASQGHGQD